MPRFFNIPRSSGGTQRPEEAVQHDPDSVLDSLPLIDSLGIQWLGEAPWYLAKALTFLFWAVVALSYAFLVPHESKYAVASIWVFMCAMTVLAICAGGDLLDAFAREQERTNLAMRKWQEDGCWHELERIQRESSAPLWGSGEAEGVGDYAPSADIIPFQSAKGGVSCGPSRET